MFDFTSDVVAAEREYKNRDTINVSKAGMGDIYEEKIKVSHPHSRLISAQTHTL